MNWRLTKRACQHWEADSSTNSILATPFFCPVQSSALAWHQIGSDRPGAGIARRSNLQRAGRASAGQYGLSASAKWPSPYRS
jgi:hypothetical protein